MEENNTLDTEQQEEHKPHASLFKVQTYVNFKYDEKVYVPVILENQSFEQLLSTNIKRNFFGNWYVLFAQVVKVMNRNMSFKQKDIQFITKYRFNIVNSRSTQIEKYKQIMYDTTPIVRAIESKYKYTNKMFDSIFSYLVHEDRKNILIYSITDENPIPALTDTIIFSLLKKIYTVGQEKFIKQIGKLPDEFYLHVYVRGKHYYAQLVADGDWSKTKTIVSFLNNFLKRITPVVDKSKSDMHVATEIAKEDEEIAVTRDKDIEPADENKVSRLYNLVSMANVQTDHNAPIKERVMNAQKEIVDKIVPKNIKVDNTRKVIDKTLDHIITPENLVIHSPIPINNKDVVAKTIASTGYAQHEFNNIDKIFSNMLDSFTHVDDGFDILSSYVTEDKTRKNRLQDSQTVLYNLKLRFKNGEDHTVVARIPKLLPDGTLRLQGNDYYIVNQFFHLPITFPKVGEAKFVSHTTTMMIDTLITKVMISVSSYRLPIGLICSFVFGLDTMLKKLDIKYTINDQPLRGFVNIPLSKEKYITINTTETNKEQTLYINSLFPYKLDKLDLDEKPLTYEWYKKLFEEITGNEDVAQYIERSFAIALDTRTLDLLRSKHQPTTMLEIIYFMYTNVINGYSTARNDLREMRIRNYESVAQIVVDKIRRELSVYNRGLKYGTSNLKFNIEPDDFLKEIIRSSSVNILTRTNPVNEISQMQKVTYAGYKGIPADSVSILLKGIHDTYYGTVDPVNTPEGATTGVNQTFTSDVSIISKYGTILPHAVGTDSNIFSIGASLSPFISKDEPARAIMMSNQVNQAVPLKESQIPNVMTGYETVVPQLASDNFVIKSPCDGTVEEVNNKYITVKCKQTKEIIKLDLKPSMTRSSVGIGSYLTFKPNVSKEDKLVKNQILADNEFIKDGILSMGRNFLTTFAFWKGYNFEDGVVLSETVAPKMTSSHAITLFLYLDETSRLYDIDIKKGVEVQPGTVFVKASSVKLGELVDSGIINENDVIIEGNQFKLTSMYKGKVEDYEIYINSKQMPHETVQKIRNLNVEYSDQPYIYKNKTLKGAFIKIKLIAELPIELGDKMTNRHAAKGVVSLIEKEENMPILPDGRRVEIIVNPLSVVNRTNAGQVYELYCGEISYQIQKFIAKSSKTEIHKLLNKISDIDKIGMVSRIAKLIQSGDTKILEYIKKHSFPIVVPPFNESNFQDVKHVMSELKIPDKYKLYIPQYDTTVNAPAGYMYFYKLHHLSNIKIHARSVGTYMQKTGQPTGGKKQEGGLRVGEMDMWSLMSYDAKNIIKELFSFGSDNAFIKQKMYRQIVDTGNTNLNELTREGSKAKQYMNSLFKAILIDIGGENEF